MLFCASLKGGAGADIGVAAAIAPPIRLFDVKLSCTSCLITSHQGRMKRYEDIGKFWNERGAGKIQADNDEREEKQTVRAARL